MSATLTDGELRFLIDGRSVLSGIFPKSDEADFILAQWNYIAATFSVTARTSGKKLADTLRYLAVMPKDGRVEQMKPLQAELDTLTSDITRQETEMNDIIYALYGLSAEQRRHVEASLQA